MALHIYSKPKTAYKELSTLTITTSQNRFTTELISLLVTLSLWVPHTYHIPPYLGVWCPKHHQTALATILCRFM